MLEQRSHFFAQNPIPCLQPLRVVKQSFAKQGENKQDNKTNTEYDRQCLLGNKENKGFAERTEHKSQNSIGNNPADIIRENAQGLLNSRQMSDRQ